MFDFIPIESYTSIYYQVLLFIVLITLLHTFILDINDYRNLKFIKVIGYPVFLFVILYMGLRPISGVFVDMTMYAYTFERFQENNPIRVTEDYAFYFFMEFCSKIISKEAFFFVCACLYVIPLWYLSRKWFKAYWFYSFLFLCISFSFWAYGTNGIRNGIATSLFLLAMTHTKRKTILILLLVLSCTFHKTMVLTTIALSLTYFFKNSKLYLKSWFFAILLSLLFGNLFVQLFGSLGFEDNRIDLYFTDQIDEAITKTGFRWDFLIYSATGVFAGWYYIIKKGFKDELYEQLFNIYLIANSFWILVIRANFSNRFAYLSWFMLGIIIIYPLLKTTLVRNQHSVIGLILLVYFSFTYLMNVILVK